MLEFCPLPSQGETSGPRPVLVKLVIVCLTSIMQLKQLVFAFCFSIDKINDMNNSIRRSLCFEIALNVRQRMTKEAEVSLK